MIKLAWPYARPSFVHRDMHGKLDARGHRDEDHCMPAYCPDAYRGLVESAPEDTGKNSLLGCRVV